MQRWLLAGVLGVVSVGGSVRGQAVRDPQHPRWFADYEAARVEARRSDKPLFVVFRCVP
jgi:hypothetical protein